MSIPQGNYLLVGLFEGQPDPPYLIISTFVGAVSLGEYKSQKKFGGAGDINCGLPSGLPIPTWKSYLPSFAGV